MEVIMKWQEVAKIAKDCGVKHIDHFLAQCHHESGNFKILCENLNYSPAALMKLWPRRIDQATANRLGHHPADIANFVYANRMGNGDVASGDGWRFKGRGFIQLTGRSNYTNFFKSLGKPIAPEYLETIQGAAESAAWFWKNRLIDTLIEKTDGNVETVTKIINGGFNGLSHRKELTRHYAALL